jgi:hypothetical protein
VQLFIGGQSFDAKAAAEFKLAGWTNTISTMIAQFALLLVLGMSLMWAVMPRAQVTAGFFRIQMLIALGLSVLALLTLGRLVDLSGEPLAEHWLIGARVSIGVMAFLAYVGSVVWTLDWRSVGGACVSLILTTAVTSLLMSRGGFEMLTSAPGAFSILSNLSTAAVLGGAVTGMLLGHWYLTAPTMSIEPLKQLSFVFGIAVAVRLMVSAAGWMMAGDRLHNGTHWTWFSDHWPSLGCRSAFSDTAILKPPRESCSPE